MADPGFLSFSASVAESLFISSVAEGIFGVRGSRSKKWDKFLS